MKKPMHQLIQENIKKEILSGKLKHKDPIPSEHKLSIVYNVSRMTIRQALIHLVNEGYLYRHKGKGTFVNLKQKKQNDVSILGFTKHMKQMNRHVTSRVISFETVAADSEVSEALFLKMGEEVFYVERIRYGDKIPVAFEKRYIPKRMFKSMDAHIFTHSFYSYISENLNFKMSYCVQSTKAIQADQRISDFLEIPSFSPVLHTIRQTFSEKGFPFEYVKTFYRSDQYDMIQTIKHHITEIS